jgi:competence protein ComGC
MKTAFTLSELLISLSAPGLIMALTLPNVFNAVES